MKKNDYELFPLGDVELTSGETLHQAQLAYKTYGDLSPKKDNVILLPTFYTGNHYRNEGFFGEGRAINPKKHFIISVNLFGNGLSTSPNNTIPSQQNSLFPKISLWDNVFCQYRLLTEKLAVESIALVAGWSMAGCQAYQWAVQYPHMVKAILPFCASAKTSRHNFVFLEGVRAALCADQTFNQGEYDTPPVAGLKAFARVYAGWAFSQSFYREKLFQQLGFNSIEELLVDWEDDHVANWDANNLLTKLATWQNADISKSYDNNFVKALASIKAKTILMPCQHDLYFPPEDNAFEAIHIPNVKFRPYNSVWGHCAANPGNDKGFEAALDKNILELLT